MLFKKVTKMNFLRDQDTNKKYGLGFETTIYLINKKMYSSYVEVYYEFTEEEKDTIKSIKGFKV